MKKIKDYFLRSPQITQLVVQKKRNQGYYILDIKNKPTSSGNASSL